MLVRDAVRRRAVTVEAATTVTAAAATMDREAVGTLLVTDAGQLVGIVTDRDLVVRGLARRVPGDARVDSVMTTPVHAVDANTDLHEAVELFAQGASRRLPVLDRDELVGVLTVDDLVVDLVNDLGRALRPVTAQVLFAHPEPRSPATVRRGPRMTDDQEGHDGGP